MVRLPLWAMSPHELVYILRPCALRLVSPALVLSVPLDRHLVGRLPQQHSVTFVHLPLVGLLYIPYWLATSLRDLGIF
jgi:hypothetical protein